MDARDRATRSRSGHRPCLHRHVAVGQMGEDGSGRASCDQAEVGRDRTCSGCVELDLVTLLVQVDLAVPELESMPTSAEHDVPHAGHALIEVGCR